MTAPIVIWDPNYTIEIGKSHVYQYNKLNVNVSLFITIHRKGICTRKSQKV